MFGNKVLSKKEQKHLKEMGVKTLFDFKMTRKGQKELESQFPNTTACFECQHIAKKLGMED